MITKVELEKIKSWGDGIYIGGGLRIRVIDTIEKMEDALSFYALRENHHTRSERLGCGCCSDIKESLVDEDDGEKARAVLAEFDGGAKPHNPAFWEGKEG